MEEIKLDKNRTRNLIQLGFRVDDDWFKRGDDYEYSLDVLVKSLPRGIEECGLIIAPFGFVDGWAVSYVDFDKPIDNGKDRFYEYHRETGEELIDAVYKMLVYLLKNHEL